MPKNLLMEDARRFKKELSEGNQEGILKHISAFDSYDDKWDELEMMLNYNVFDKHPEEFAKIMKKMQLTSNIYDPEFQKNLEIFQGKDFFAKFNIAFHPATAVVVKKSAPSTEQEFGKLDIESMEEEVRISPLKNEGLKKQK